MDSIIKRAFSPFAVALRAITLTLVICATGGAWADTEMTNPVTGETETYVNAFTGGTSEWNSTDNWDTGNKPFISGNYDPAVVDGATVSTSSAIDGWTLRVGAYNGASIAWNGGITKIQAGSAGCWLTADETSSITIASFAGNQLEGSDTYPFKLSSANAGGITWSAGLTAAGNTTLPFWYYLKGTGTVVYGGDITVANAQVIKQADITLSGTSQVTSKTLVTFGSGTTKTFTADATIKRLNSSGTDLNDDAHVATVNTTGTTTLTTSDAVGTCELVQTSTGIVLYYVDGDPANLPAATVYKPSININFTDGTSLSTAADVGISEYAIPGTSWNNLIGNNGSLNTVTGVNSTGAASTISGAKVTISGTRGYWTKSGLAAASDLRQAYIDDADGSATPTVVVEGIPYYKYKLVLYFSNDTDGRQFGHLTINGTNYKWDSTNSEIVTCDGTSSDVWGSSSSTAYTEGGNYLVFPAMANTDGTLTVVGHRWSGTQRMGVAAIQIVEVKPEVSENDLEIPVSGSTTYTVSEAKTLSGTVYLTGNGTLTLDGSAKITAATIDVGINVTLNINADRLDGTTFTGAGTVVYDGTKPASGKGWTESSAWKGTVWVKNIPTSSNERKDWNLALYGNADSTLRFTGVNLYFPNNTTTTFPGTVDIDGEGMNVCDGYGGSIATFARLTGSGTLSTTGGSSNGNGLTINDASGFTGTITLTKYKVIVGTSTGTSSSGVLQVESGKSITVAGATAPGGFVVNGTLVANGTLASSAAAAVTGSGTVTFGGVPSPVDGENETKWWKNAGWTGTVEIKGAGITGTGYAFNDYGNAGSTVKLTNCSGWLTGGYTCVPALEIGGTFSWNDGWSGTDYTFKVGTLKGSGTISIPNQGAATAVWQITDNWSGFTGAVVGNNNAGKRVLVFGSTLPKTVEAGEIYISEGATLNLDNASSAWWGVGMKFVVDGTVKATKRSKWGGGTAMELGSTGVLEITRADSASDDDGGTDYSNVTGTGTIKFSGSGFTVLSQSIPTSLTFAAEKASGSVVPVASATIGSLTGSKGFRSDWGTNGAGGRYLTVKQSKDTVWEGSINAGGTHRLTGVVVDPGESTTGTLTLTATQTASSTLTVNGAVNLTGTWVGATTVAGTFGGTGTVTGNLTLTDGATFKAAATALTVSGTVTLPTEAGETLTIDATGLDADEVTILSSSSITTETDVSKVTVANGLYNATPVAGALKLVSSKVEITVPAIANTTVTVSVGGETIGTASGTYKVAPDAVVTVTYAAASGYEISGTTVYTINVANSETTFDPSSTTVAKYVAQIVGGASYTSLQAAVTAVAAINNGKMLLVGSAEGMIATIPAPAPAGRVQFYIAANGNTEGTVSAPAGDYIMTTASQTIQIDYDDYPATKYTVVEAAVAVTISGSRSLYGASYINDAVNAAIAGGLGSTIEFVNGTDSAPYVTTLETSGFTVENNVWTFTTMPVAKVTHGVIETKYLTLETAVANAQSGDTITLLGDVTLTTPVAISETLTLDLNGYAITASGIDAITSSGALTIQGSSDSISVTSGNSVVLTDSAATLTVTGVTLSPEPTTNVSRHRVVSSTSAGTTSYIVEVIPGTIFSVY